MVDREILLGLALGAFTAVVMCGLPLGYFYRRHKRDSDLISKANAAIQSCDDSEAATIKFFEANENALYKLLSRSIRSLKHNGITAEAVALTEALQEWKGKRYIDGLHLNSALLDTAEKVAAYKQMGFEDAKVEDPKKGRKPILVSERPVLRLVVRDMDQEHKSESESPN